MDKDEMKNRISLALKDPILQQGFEIICKKNAKLKEENIGLRARINAIDSLTPELEKSFKLQKQKQQRTRAKELLETWMFYQVGAILICIAVFGSIILGALLKIILTV